MIHEPSARMRGILANRIREIETRLRPRTLPDGTTVVGLLDRHARPGTVADFSCDRCGRYCPSGLRLGRMVFDPTDGTDRPLVLGVGLCDPCADTEGWPPE